MHMYKTGGQDMHNRADDAARNQMLTNARNEAKADAAVSFSSHLDRLATHAAVNHMSGVEIIELLKQESEKFDHQTRTAKMGACNV